MAELAVFADGLGFPEGPTWLGDGGLAVASISDGAVYVLRDGSIEQRFDVGGGPQGTVLAADGSLLVTQNGGIWGAPSQAEPGVVRIAPDGTVTSVATGFDAPNDLCVGPDGALWVTDQRGESDPHDPSTALPGRVHRVDAATGANEVLIEGPAFVNSLAFDAAGTSLFVVETSRGRVIRYPFRDGVLGDGETFLTVAEGVPDGLAFDRDGRLWVTTALGDTVEVHGPDGELVEVVRFPAGSCPTNCCFGGPDGSTLFVTASFTGQVLTLATDTAGLALLPAPAASAAT